MIFAAFHTTESDFTFFEKPVEQQGAVLPSTFQSPSSSTCLDRMVLDHLGGNSAKMNKSIAIWETKDAADITFKVQEAQIQQLYRQTWGGLIGTVFIAFSACFVLWQVIPQWKLSLWIGFLILLTIARGILASTFQRKAPLSSDIYWWANLQVIGVVASGLVWGLPSFFLWPDNSPVHQMIWPICIVALSASAVAKYCVWTPSYVSFLLLAMVPLSFRLFFEGGGVYTALGLLGFVFIAILAQTGKEMHAANLRALEMGLRNEALSSFLSEGKAQLEELNVQLQQEIAERTQSQKELHLQNQKLERLNFQLTTAKSNLELTNKELEDAIINIKQLSGMLPICASCKKIRNDSGYWEQIEAYIQNHSEAEFSHGICPGCAERLYPDIFNKIKMSC